MNYFVTGIDTDSGKTLVSAILCEALNADYWKPVQAGLPLDRETVKGLVSNPSTVFHDEQYFLKLPASPHAAAKLEDIRIEMDCFELPRTERTVIIEGAGGCLVPLNQENFVIEIAERFNSEIVLVADLYLGSINHTLLSVSELRRRGLPLKGIIFNGERNPQSEEIILHHADVRCLLRIEKEKEINRQIVRSYADKLLLTWNA
ncbi:dethiobiotin synthase [Chryseolinea sp. T2]|uniref:dethiobiotin synthase n=1 Tax=Chryseolinea sp. T2 TaxID=3129255 RepID=UPI003076FCC8